MHQQQAHRLPAEDRRRQLLETALNLFSRKGFEGTTTKEIAAAAGVTEAIIFRHFPSKQALYTAVLDCQHESGEHEPVIARWKSLMDANDDAGLFRALIDEVIAGYRRDSRVHRALFYAALEGHEAGLQLYRERSLPVFELLCQYVARRQSEGAIRAGIPPQAIVGAVAGTAAHFSMMTQFFGFQHDGPDSGVVEAFMNIFLHGILPAAVPERATL
ncbi:MAG: TetR/AcrR family transcriptional regulator [Acidobacteria bacterium]|nr:TetR/AcrR family transcriptional regulator [Acidobacteriota bacterium]